MNKTHLCLSRHACLWTHGTRKDLGDMGGVGSYAYALNNSGDIVGRFLDQKRQFHAFIIHNGHSEKLDQLVSLPPGTRLEDATGINDNGWIVGTIVTPKGNLPFLLTPLSHDHTP